jgi:hypothetical protein
VSIDSEKDDLLSEIAASSAEMADRRADELLLAAYSDGGADVFAGDEPAQLEAAKNAAARLVQLRLAYYADEARDRIHITNSGRYWALNGGYMAFLKEDPPTGGGGTRGRNPEVEALRATYMKLRLNTFWLSFGMSIAGFLISLISLGIALVFGDRGLR